MKGLAGWAAGTAAGAIVLFGAFAAVLWQAGLFNFTGTDPSAKVVAASVALVGGFLGAVLAFCGTLLAYSVQRRAERRQEVDVAMRAVGLLTTSTGVPASPAQRAGVLFALERLGMLPLALSMLQHMLATDQLDSAAAVRVLNQGLAADTDALVVEAANILYDAAPKLAGSGGYAFPNSVDLRWPMQLPEQAREMVALARMRLVLSLPRPQWRSGDLFSHTASLIAVWRSETCERIKRDVALFLIGLLTVYEERAVLYPPGGAVRVDEVRADLAKWVKPETKPTALGRPLISDLEKWLEGRWKS